MIDLTEPGTGWRLMDIADEMINEIVSFKMPAIMRNQDESLIFF
jgi:hypothetical protein